MIYETLILEIHFLFSLCLSCCILKNQNRVIIGRDMTYLVTTLIVFFEMITTDTDIMQIEHQHNWSPLLHIFFVNGFVLSGFSMHAVKFIDRNAVYGISDVLFSREEWHIHVLTWAQIDL